MSSKKMTRKELLQAIGDEGRKNSTSNVLFHQANAESLGLNTTDYKCLGIIIEQGAISAGELSELTGLTSGSMTTALDRLEKSNFVRRAADPNDRRRVLIEANRERMPELEVLFKGFLEALAETMGHYTDDELAVILDYLQRTTALYNEQASRLKSKNM